MSLSRLAQAVMRLYCVQNTTDLNPSISYCFVEQQCNSGLGHLIVEVSRSRIIRHTHTHPVGLLRTSDLCGQRPLPPPPPTHTQTHNKHKRRICILSTGFEPANPAIERARTCALDCTATGFGFRHLPRYNVTNILWSSPGPSGEMDLTDLDHLLFSSL